jgi:hypothetical protein
MTIETPKKNPKKNQPIQPFMQLVNSILVEQQILSNHSQFFNFSHMLPN